MHLSTMFLQRTKPAWETYVTFLLNKPQLLSNNKVKSHSKNTNKSKSLMQVIY